MTSKYSDIINLPHHQSKTHPHMSQLDRAAQFAPFAALTGYEEAIIEAAKINEEKKIISSDEIQEIRNKLLVIESQLSFSPLVKVTYFDASQKRYVDYTGNVKKIDKENKYLVFSSKKKIHFKAIYKIEL